MAKGCKPRRRLLNTAEFFPFLGGKVRQKFGLLTKRHRKRLTLNEKVSAVAAEGIGERVCKYTYICTCCYRCTGLWKLVPFESVLSR